MIDKARARGAPSMLMTYPAYDFPTVADFEDLAAAKHIPLVRNDITFKPLLAPEVVDKYFFADHNHPRENGYAMIAESAARVIEQQDLLHLEKATASTRLR
jgi:hypothetical protein